MKILIVVFMAVLLSIPATRATAQAFEVANKRAVASDSLQAAADTQRTCTTLTSTTKEFFVLYGGIVRLRWRYRSSLESEPVVVLIKSGQANSDSEFLCSKQTDSQTFFAETCDVPVTAGSQVEVKLKCGSGPGAIRNLRMYFNLVNVPAPAVVLQN